MSINLDKISRLYVEGETPFETVSEAPQKAFVTIKRVDEEEQEKAVMLPISCLVDFPKGRYNRFREYTGEKMEDLENSIRINGILQPLIVRPLPEGKYQIISGHNRRSAARNIGYESLPCIVRVLEDEQALDQLNSINVQQRELLPSEKAFAYERESRHGQGIRNDISTSCQPGTKLKSEFSEDSSRTKYRFIRLTRLTEERLLNAVDEGILGVTVAGDVAKLTAHHQKLVTDFFFETGEGGLKSRRPLTQTLVNRILEAEEENKLDLTFLERLFAPKNLPTNYKCCRVKMEPLRKKYPLLKNLSESEMEKTISMALEEYFKAK